MKGTSRIETPSYVCGNCGHRSAKWMGFCAQCRNQEALVETAAPRRSSQKVVVESVTAAPSGVRDRHPVGIGELDRVLGGGVVPGSVLLVGGEPGIGKSTLILQAADRIAGSDGSVLYTTAEESVHQIQLRARRIGVTSPGIEIASVYDVDDIIAAAGERHPRVLIVDSIQMVSSAQVGGTVGGTAQVRESAARLIAFSKSSGVPLILVGHVTKDGSIAGPRTLEHMVDVVLYLEGDSDQGLRFLRGIKNRYGSVNEIGVFSMTQRGLEEVPDPSGLLTSQRDADAPGSVLFPTVEGKRPMVVEVQALVVATDMPQPRRAVTGLPTVRVHQIIGVLERHAALPLRSFEVYVSVMGGVKISEPAADLPVALAIASAFGEYSLGHTAAYGEVGLTGEIRPVVRAGVRNAELERLGSGPIISPETQGRLVDAMIATGFTSARSTG